MLIAFFCDNRDTLGKIKKIKTKVYDQQKIKVYLNY